MPKMQKVESAYISRLLEIKKAVPKRNSLKSQCYILFIFDLFRAQGEQDNMKYQLSRGDCKRIAK